MLWFAYFLVSSITGLKVACIASVSAWFRSEERPRNGILGFGHARNETRAALVLTPFFAQSLTLVPRSLLLNRTETLATQAIKLKVFRWHYVCVFAGRSYLWPSVQLFRLLTISTMLLFLAVSGFHTVEKLLIPSNPALRTPAFCTRLIRKLHFYGQFYFPLGKAHTFSLNLT